MAFGVLATAQAPPPDNAPHLLLVPSDPEGTAALARTDARVIARYESFSLVEARGGDDQRLRGAGAERRDDMRTVETAAGEIDPRADRLSLAAKEGPDRQETLALVQFVGPPKEAWVERLRETGARIVTYQADNAYVVHASGAAVDRVAALQGGHPAVRAVSVLTAADKLEERSSRSGVFAVTTVTGAPGEEARDEAAVLAGAAAAAPVTVGAMRTEYRQLTSAEVAELAREPGVVAVEAYAEPELFDERAAQIVAGNLIPTDLTQPIESDYGTWLLTKIPDDSIFGFAIDVTDEGFDNGAVPPALPAHSDFRVLGSGATRVSYVANHTSDSDARDCSGHGTNVASIAAGYNANSNSPAESDDRGFNHGMGVAPFARVGASKIFECDGDFSTSWTPAGLAATAYAGLARISNNSWGTGSSTAWGDYSARSAAYDQLVRDAHPDPGQQPMLEVFAAGNHGEENPGSFNEGYGTVSAEGSAKNVITVGATESVRDTGPPDCGTLDNDADRATDILDFSSRGPTDDGRLKPDLVAPGSRITGAAPQHAGYAGFGVCHPLISGSPLYSLVSGTSQATPGVSGAAAVVRRWYEDEHGVPPSPALTKALLVNTATDLEGGDTGKGGAVAAGPNPDQGWGRVNLGNVFSSTARVFRDQHDDDVLNKSGEPVVRAYEVDDSDERVKVTLAWTDAPGPTTGNPVVNDLDLVVDAGGRTYKGNVFAGEFSRIGGSADPRNNLESVYLPEDTSGRFAVKVIGTNIPGDGIPGNADSTDQDFALVVSNAEQQGSPVLVHEQTTLDDSPAAGGDGDGALEPGESFELDEELRNAGDAGATGVAGSLTSETPGLTITLPNTSTWANIAAGASQPSDTRFEGALSAAATCGADVSASLALTSAGIPHTVPLTLATGGEAELPQSQSRTHGSGGIEDGLSIPDDDAVGVTSTINVTTAGLIKDLDVRISDLDHGWVGDLRIELTGPDGTTVQLVQHPGGPDNNGKNFVNTVFDDEAPTAISVGAPYTGRFRPQNDQLSRFDGKQQQGVWTLRVRDLFEGDTGSLDVWGTDTTTASCAVDGTTPETTIGPGGPAEGAIVRDTSPEFNFSSDAAGATFECQLDGGTYGLCTSPKSYTGLTSGIHTFRVRAKDGAKVDPTPATRTWTVDAVAPDTAITSGPSAGARLGATSASFQFVSPDSPSATFECRLDVAEDPDPPPPFSACNEPVELSGLSEGTYTFSVTSWDVAGNVDPTPATRTWTVDLTPPDPTVQSAGPISTDITPTLSGTAGFDPHDSSTVTVKIYQGASSAGALLRTLSTTRNATGEWSVNVTPPLSVGQFTAVAEQADDTVPPNVGASDDFSFSIQADTVPPDTIIDSGPAGAVAAGDAAFTFHSDEPGSDFTCSLNGAAPSPCGSPHSVSGLGDGQHTFAVTAIDPAGNPDPNPAIRTWTVDLTTPAPKVTSPANGQRLSDTTPTLRGTAGTAAGDAGTVTVKLWNGTLAAGLPAQMLVVPRDSQNGAWSAEPAELALGTWTVQVEQSDAIGHVGMSAPSSFTVVAPGPTDEDGDAPSFVLAPAEERIAEALAGRLTAVAGCASACRIDARLSASSRAARSLGLGRRATVLGKGSKRLSKAGTVTAAVRLNKRARGALRRRDEANVSLRLTLTDGGKTVTLSRSLSLRRSAGLRRIVSGGLRLWAMCSERCPLSGKLTLLAKEARRIGLKPRGSKRMQVAAGRTTGQAGRPAGLTLKVRRGAKKAMSKAHRVRALLDAVAGAKPDPRRKLTHPLTLRR